MTCSNYNTFNDFKKIISKKFVDIFYFYVIIAHMKNKFIKKIEINNDKLDFNNTIEFYKQYLLTPRLDWQNEMTRPIRHNVFVSMCATHAKYGENPINLIEETIRNGGKLYFWSDLHFFHNNIIRYASRPFETVEHMNQTLINNYWSIVKEEDIVIFGGDIAFGEIEHTKEILKLMPGKKVLVLGNHDFDRNKCIYRNYHSFDIVTMAFSFEKEIENKKYNIMVTHYPIHYSALPPKTINIHGHIHQREAGEKNINMSVEHTNFSPIKMDEKIEFLIKNIDFKKK